MELKRKLNRLRKSSGLTSKMDNTFVYNIKLNNMELKRKLKWKLKWTIRLSTTLLQNVLSSLTSFFTPHFTPLLTSILLPTFELIEPILNVNKNHKFF